MTDLLSIALTLEGVAAELRRLAGTSAASLVSMTPGAIRARRARERTKACATVRARALENAEIPPESGDGGAREAHAVRTPCAGGGRGGSCLEEAETLQTAEKTQENTEETHDARNSARAHASAREAHETVRSRARTVRTAKGQSEPDPDEPPFTTAAFQEAWAGFRAMRDKTGKPMTARAIRLAWKALQAAGEPLAVKALDTCTALNWQGVDWGIERARKEDTHDRAGTTRAGGTDHRAAKRAAEFDEPGIVLPVRAGGT